MLTSLTRNPSNACTRRPARSAPLSALPVRPASSPSTTSWLPDFRFSLDNKLMGQVNLVRYGLGAVADHGSITITSGILAQRPSRGSGAVSLVNAGLEGFVRAAALEAPRGIRINVVSPPWVTETLQALGMPLQGGLPAATVAQAYVRSVEGTETGQVISP